MQIIVKQSYNHLNTAFKNWNTPKGRYIKDKNDYERAMREEGMITCEEAADRVKKLKNYNLSGEAKEIINEAKLKSRNGKVKLSLSDGLTSKMIEKGIIKQKGFGLEHLPEHLKRGI